MRSRALEKRNEKSGKLQALHQVDQTFPVGCLLSRRPQGIGKKSLNQMTQKKKTHGGERERTSEGRGWTGREALLKF